MARSNTPTPIVAKIDIRLKNRTTCSITGHYTQHRRQLALNTFDPDGQRIGEALFNKSDSDKVWSAETVYVEPGWRRRGVATALYDRAEQLGLQLEPSAEIDEDGALFWATRECRSEPALNRLPD